MMVPFHIVEDDVVGVGAVEVGGSFGSSAGEDDFVWLSDWGGGEVVVGEKRSRLG